MTDIQLTPPAFVAKQIDACLTDIGCDVVKIGMLASADIVDVVADKLAEYGVERVVLDPVMVATSGAQLLPGDAVGKLCGRLVRRAELVTPNVPEAVLMVKESYMLEGKEDVDVKTPSNLQDLKDLARTLKERLAARNVLVKGGHMPLAEGEDGELVKPKSDKDARKVVCDVLFDGKDFEVIRSEYRSSKNTHGTGCSLASAIASNLARGHDLSQAVRLAIDYVGEGIRTAPDLGKVSGPINHFHSMQRLPFSKGRFIPWLLDRPDVKPTWQKYVRHPFARAMGDGSLPVEAFKEYLIQDYLYLVHFARTNALAGYKSNSIETIAASAQIVSHIRREMELHLDYCASFGLSKPDIEAHKESTACVAYSRYVLDIGMSQDYLALQMALAPCLLGYGLAASMLEAEFHATKDGNEYWKWIENYVAEDYQEAVRKGSELIEKHIWQQSPARVEELVKIFVRATEMEVDFWRFEAHKILS